MRRFYVAPASVGSDRIVLDQEESHHLVRVLRLQQGETVELFDGTGALYTGKIEKLGKRVAVSLESQKHHQAEQRGGSVILCQGDLKGGKMDFLVEKATELGVERFIPFSAGRSQGRLDEARSKQRRQRRLSIVKKACKQSGRVRFSVGDQVTQIVTPTLTTTEADLHHGKQAEAAEWFASAVKRSPEDATVHLKRADSLVIAFQRANPGKTLLGDQILQGATLDEFHPEAHVIVDVSGYFQ